MYKVIDFFTDLQDNNHPYNVGEVFPRSGLTVSENRLIELAGINNKQGRPLIKEDGKNATSNKSDKDYSKSDIMLMRKADLINLAKELGIENADTASGTDLKQEIVELLKL